MANYRLSMKLGKIGYAKPHAEYVLREGKYAKGHKREDLQYKQSGNMPQWALNNPVEFWEAADLFEPVNGRTYREFEVSLPNELSLEENIELLNEFKEEMLSNSHAYTYAIHTSYNNGQQNTHAHFMFTERKNDGIERDIDTFFKRANPNYPERGGAKKDREWQKKEKLLHAREIFADITNKHYEKAGLDLRVDHRSNEAQLLEALKNGDLDKVDYLTRYPVNIPGRLLNKVEKALTEWEKKQISEYHVNRQIKREKEAAYKAKLNKSVPLEKEELILELKKIDKKLDENQLRKSTLNSITNGNYYKHLNQMWKIREEIKKTPSNLELKKELEEIRSKAQEIEEYLPDTQRYIKKYKALETAYSKKRTHLLKELESRFNVKEEELTSFHTEEKVQTVKENIKISKLRINIDLTSHLKVKDTLENITQKLEILNSKLKDSEQIKNEAMDRVSGYKFSSLKSTYYSLKRDSSREEYFNTLKKECGKLYTNLEDPTIKSLVAKESYKVVDQVKKEITQLTLEKEILENSLTKTKAPEKDALDKHNVERLINLRGDYESSRFNIERLKERIITTSMNTNLKPETIEKKTTQYARLLAKETEQAAVLEALVEKQEKIVKEIPRLKIIEISKAYKSAELEKQNELEKGVENLEMLLKSKDKVKKLAINQLTKGKFNDLENRKSSFQKELDPLEEEKRILENKIRLCTGVRSFFEKRKYINQLDKVEMKLKPYKEKYNYLDKEQKKLINNLDKERINKKTEEIKDNLTEALYKTKSKLNASKGKSYISQELVRKKYKELPRVYFNFNSKRNPNNLRNIDELLRDNVSYAQGRQTTRSRFLNKERDKTVVELER